MNLNRFLGIEIYLIHVGHFLLFVGALAILALNVPWWAVLASAPLVGLGVVGWLYEASIVLPVASNLLRKENVASHDIRQDELPKD